jgi:hypothetical protein
MPTNRKRIARGRRQRDIHPLMWARLNDAPCPEDASRLARWWFYDYPFRCAVTRDYKELWANFRGQILERWIRKSPGTRPSFWWHYDAPPLTPESIGGYHMPRERAGGKGTSWEHSPSCQHGFPDCWHEEGFDSNDPPRFESEASYLDRHGLLLPGERRRLKREDFEPEVLPPEFWPELSEQDDPDGA